MAVAMIYPEAKAGRPKKDEGEGLEIKPFPEVEKTYLSQARTVLKFTPARARS